MAQANMRTSALVGTHLLLFCSKLNSAMKPPSVFHKFNLIILYPLFDKPGCFLKDLAALQELIVNKPLTEQCFLRLPSTPHGFELTKTRTLITIWIQSCCTFAHHYWFAASEQLKVLLKCLTRR
ncbi:hypothetical protein BDR06DRAFT_93393 [Suillus hirtellus]|nr:hypothetical protein BDR06DRAFT_93393 [Suillus hirtellus]